MYFYKPKPKLDFQQIEVDPLAELKMWLQSTNAELDASTSASGAQLKDNLDKSKVGGVWCFRSSMVVCPIRNLMVVGSTLTVSHTFI